MSDGDGYASGQAKADVDALPPAHTDERMVPAYLLPDVLQSSAGESVDVHAWPQRRAELLTLFRDNVYGHAPSDACDVRVVERNEWMIGGEYAAGAPLASRVQLRCELSTAHASAPITILITLPRDATLDQPVPAVIGHNFAGNHTTSADPRVALPTGWVPSRSAEGVSGGRASEVGRGCLARRWPMLEAAAAGVAVVTVYSGDFAEDHPEQWQSGVHRLYPDGPDEPGGDSHAAPWGCIATWSWGLSRVLDALVAHEPRINPHRVGTIGHSRMGKAALWAAAQDERFACAIVNNSGCTGAALSRRCFGERLVHITTRFPHWFTPNYSAFAERESELPIDQHQLLALVAPRPLYVASAAGDLWADPDGELAACVAAEPVWRLLAGASDAAGLSAVPVPPALQVSYGALQGGAAAGAPAGSYCAPISYHRRGSARYPRVGLASFSSVCSYRCRTALV